MRANRIPMLDTLRGLAMVLMVLDHARYFASNVRISPVDLEATTVPLFATRWITHICQPIFFLLAGASVYFASTRTSPRRAVVRYLLTRGAVMILLEITILELVWQGALFDPAHLTLQVIWVFGCCMILFAVLLSLDIRLRTLLLGAVTFLAALPWLRTMSPHGVAELGPIWTVLVVGGDVPLSRDGTVFISFVDPVLPWCALMVLGYGLGAFLVHPRLDIAPARRRRILASVGVALIAAFAVLRILDIGDPTSARTQPRLLFTIMSFVNVTKAPPSLLFMILMLGVALVLLACIGDRDGIQAAFLQVYGRVPLFFYVAHLTLLCLWMTVTYSLRFGTLPDAHSFHADWGYSLPGVYVVWLAALLLLHPACRWYARVKAGRAHHILRYL